MATGQEQQCTSDYMRSLFKQCQYYIMQYSSISYLWDPTALAKVTLDHRCTLPGFQACEFVAHVDTPFQFANPPSINVLGTY
jgi:hypothetical protein